MSDEQTLHEQCLAKLEDMLNQPGDIIVIPDFSREEITALLKHVSFMEGFKTAVWEITWLKETIE